MNRFATRASTALVALVCAFAICAAPAVAAQGDPPAGQEYNLDLPGGGDAPPQQTDAPDSDSGGFPVIVVILVAGAGIAAGIAAWRMRKPGDPPESS